MFIQLWNKYLPVIKILLKRSAGTEQTLSMNKTDFERAAGGKKLKHSFKIYIRDCKLENAPKQSQLVKQFHTALIEDEITKQLLKHQDYQFILNNNFQLLIRNCNTVPVKNEPKPLDQETINSEANAAEHDTVS